MREGIFRELESEDCLDLLRTHTVGRVAWETAAGEVMVLPVNYVYLRERILFRTSPHAVLAELVGTQAASFQVDDIDVDTGNGWAVLAVGHTVEEDVQQLVEAGEELPDTWLEDHKDLLIAIEPTQITGRVIDRPQT